MYTYHAYSIVFQLCGNIIIICESSSGLLQVKLYRRMGNSTESFILSSCSLVPVYEECNIGITPFHPWTLAHHWKPSTPAATRADSLDFIQAVNERRWTDVVRLTQFPSLVRLFYL